MPGGRQARMVELVDTQDLKSCGRLGRVGSSPTPGTMAGYFQGYPAVFNLDAYLMFQHRFNM